jgi:hypothetical protein
MKKVLLVTLLASMITLPVFATPSSIVMIPSTDIVSEGKLHMDIDTAIYENSGSNSDTSYGLTYGFKNGEVGIDYLQWADNDQAIYNLKFGLVNKEKTKLVIGAQGLGSGTTKQNLVYLLGSQKSSDGTRFTLGFGAGDKDTLGPDENVIMAGIDKQLSDKWWGAVDYISGDSYLGALSFGVSYAVAPNASVLVSYSIANNNDNNNMFTTQIDINF